MDVKDINKRLLDLYGKDLYGNPRFRIVWSDSQTEKRSGTFNVWYGKIFVRKEVGIREVPKYTYINSKWVLEQISPNPYEDVDAKLSYEPLWVFQDKKGNPLQPVWSAVEIILYSLFNPQKLTPGQLKEQEEKEFAKQIQDFEDQLSGETSYLASMLANKEAVVVPK